jgi:hypothetical protein
MKRANGAGRHDLRNVPEPLAGYPGDLPTSSHNTRRDLTPVAVIDVYDAQRRVRALARIDLLDRERRSGAINEAQYQIGREIERVFEPMKRISGGGQWHEGDRIDAATSADLATMLGMERAYAVNAFLRWMVRHLGPNDTRLIWFVLGRGHSYGVAAVAFKRHGVRGLRYTIDRFRDALSALADAKAARGRALR